MLEGLRRRLASFPAGFELGWRGSLEKATVALQAVSFAVSSRSGQVGLSSYHGGLVVGQEGLSFVSTCPSVVDGSEDCLLGIDGLGDLSDGGHGVGKG